MVPANTKTVIERAKQIYEKKKQELESQHHDQFISIEPESGECFVGDSFDDAVRAAKSEHPSRMTHTIHIGHAAAFHIGLMQQ